MPRETDAADGPADVSLPPFDVFTTEYSDAEQATLRSALASASVGVGGLFDADALHAAMASDGPCAGELTR